MDLTEEFQSVLQALHWAKRNPLTFACILSWVCFNMILISMEQTHPILSKQAENMTIVTFYQLFFGIYCVRKAFEGYRVGRPFLLATYFVIALAHFGKFYLTIAHTASNFTLFPTLFGMLEPIQDSLKDHSWLLNLTILGDAANRLYQAMPASKPHQTMKPKPKPTEKDIPWAKEIVGNLGGLGYHKIFC